MKNFKKLVVFAMAFVLMFGVVPSAYASELSADNHPTVIELSDSYILPGTRGSNSPSGSSTWTPQYHGTYRGSASFTHAVFTDVVFTDTTYLSLSLNTNSNPSGSPYVVSLMRKQVGGDTFISSHIVSNLGSKQIPFSGLMPNYKYYLKFWREPGASSPTQISFTVN